MVFQTSAAHSSDFFINDEFPVEGDDNDPLIRWPRGNDDNPPPYTGIVLCVVILTIIIAQGRRSINERASCSRTRRSHRWKGRW